MGPCYKHPLILVGSFLWAPILYLVHNWDIWVQTRGPYFRGPTGHINIRILQTMISGIPLILGLGTSMPYVYVGTLYCPGKTILGHRNLDVSIGQGGVLKKWVWVCVDIGQV